MGLLEANKDTRVRDAAMTHLIPHDVGLMRCCYVCLGPAGQTAEQDGTLRLGTRVEEGHHDCTVLGAM